MQNDDEKCCVCLLNYDDEDHVKFPIHKACNNKYHYMCIKCFINLRKKECPYCKDKPLFLNNHDLYLKDTIYGACKEGNSLKAMEYLKDKKYMGIDYIDEYGLTPLIWACSKSMENVALEIIKLGINECLAFNKSKYDFTALNIAKEHKLLKVVNELENYFSDKN